MTLFGRKLAAQTNIGLVPVKTKLIQWYASTVGKGLEVGV
jgi:hypothetical protein